MTALVNEARSAAVGFVSANALPRAAFGICICGRGIEDHGRIKPSGNPEYEYRCPHTPSGKFTALDGSRWPHGPAGVAA